jgi:hypothetical protein
MLRPCSRLELEAQILHPIQKHSASSPLEDKIPGTKSWSMGKPHRYQMACGMPVCKSISPTAFGEVVYGTAWHGWDTRISVNERRWRWRQAMLNLVP